MPHSVDYDGVLLIFPNNINVPICFCLLFCTDWKHEDLSD